MLLSATFLSDVGGVNSYRDISVIRMTEGDQIDVYLQLRDLSVNLATCGFNPPGRRYMPAASSTLSVVIDSLDDANKITKTATQPYPLLDPSIWKFSILSTDNIRGTKTLKLTLTEGTKVTRGIVQPAIEVASLDGLCN